MKNFKKRFFIPISVVLSIFTACLPVLGATVTYSNSDNSIWQKPYTGSMDAYKYTSGTAHWVNAVINGRYNSTQITNMKNTSYYPTLEIKDNSQQPFGMVGTYYSSNFPDPKFDMDYCMSAGVGSVCEIEVANKNKNLLTAATNYYLSTEWERINRNSDHYLIAWGSQSREPSALECAAGECELNTVSGSAKSLAGFWVNSLNGTWASMNKPVNEVRIASLSPSEKPPASVPEIEEKEELKKLKKEYIEISGQNSLKMFSERAKEKANKVETSKEYSFTLTFNEPVNQEALNKFNSGIDEAIIYGRGIDNNADRVTIGVNGFDKASLEKVQQNTGYDFKGFIQISGKATGEIIKKLSKETEVYAVEVAIEDHIPFGLYWKLEDAKKSN
ncbi:hypothetical protein [Paenibacillus naphthalenovorans]|uniref:hypothetical protein n=1 Tax=Paenibacillus naphthalenovorans TaxID=162209 RepID=UPI003D2E44FF